MEDAEKCTIVNFLGSAKYDHAPAKLSEKELNIASYLSALHSIQASPKWKAEAPKRAQASTSVRKVVRSERRSRRRRWIDLHKERGRRGEGDACWVIVTMPDQVLLAESPSHPCSPLLT